MPLIFYLFIRSPRIFWPRHPDAKLWRFSPARVAVELGALGRGSNAAPIVLGGAALVEGVGVGAREGEGTTVVVAGREKLGGTGGEVVETLGVLAGSLAVVVLLQGLVTRCSIISKNCFWFDLQGSGGASTDP